MKILLVALNENMNPYTVKTTGKHPVRMIEGGMYLTEYKGDIKPENDMGWFHLNTKDYNTFKSTLKEIEVDK